MKMKLPKQILKLGGLFLISFIIISGALFYSFKNHETEKVYAGVGDNVAGFAWSENIGWISFNNTNTGGGTSYGVNILENAAGVGVLSGFAWSGNIGWISFNRADTGAPPGPPVVVPPYDPGAAHGALAIIDTDNKLQGWARALIACDSVPCTSVGAGANTGGWDGWVRLNNNSTYGLTLNPVVGTSYFTKWAWGADVIGWISANRLNCDTDGNGQSNGGAGCPAAGTAIGNYAVTTNFELNKNPNAPSGTGVTPRYCSSWDSPNARLTFNWTFSDPNLNMGNQQSKYKIDISYPSFSYSTGEVNYPNGNNSANSAIVNLSNLGTWYGETLNWTLTVWDNGTISRFSSVSGTFGPLPDREYPYVTFYSNPDISKIFANQDVQFSPDRFSADKTICFSVGNTAVPCSTWSWGFAGAAPSYKAPSTSASKEPVVKFPEATTTPVTATLTVTDSAGHSCSASRNIPSIGLPLPEFQEKKK